MNRTVPWTSMFSRTGSGEGPGWRESVARGSARRASVPVGPGGREVSVSTTPLSVAAKGPCRWKALRVVTHRFPVTGRADKAASAHRSSSARSAEGHEDRKRRCATGVSEARSPRGAREDNARVPPRGRSAEAALGCREPSEVPGHVCPSRSPEPSRTSLQRKLEREPGSNEVRVHVFVRVASVGRTHRAVSPPRGRKSPRRCKVASQKEARSLVGHEARAERRRTGARVSTFPQRLELARGHELASVSL